MHRGNIYHCYMGTWQGAIRVLLVLLLGETHGYGQSGPQAPCGNPPVPLWPAVDAPAAVQAWSRVEFGHNWSPPACTGWTAAGFSTLVTTAARFRGTPDAESLLRHIGAISKLAGVSYWSATHRQWQTLIVDAWAITGLRNDKRRGDFAAGEMKPGAVLYYRQTDNLSGKAVYRLHISEASAERIVFDVENVTTLRYLLIPVFHPGDMQSAYFLDREPDNVWRFYSILRTGQNANGLIAANQPSAINRAVALYRSLVGIPTSQEPPAAR